MLKLSSIQTFKNILQVRALSSAHLPSRRKRKYAIAQTTEMYKIQGDNPNTYAPPNAMHDPVSGPGVLPPLSYTTRFPKACSSSPPAISHRSSLSFGVAEGLSRVQRDKLVLAISSSDRNGPALQ
ncbi:hypothetical protein VTH06DRAFT_2637 [Thermothelomyces fergusii]